MMIDWQTPAAWSVLIVDDEADNLELIAESLDFFGAMTRTARNGAEGLEVLRAFEPCLILLDLSMPTMDGWTMRTRLKDNPETRDIPVIALTAHVMRGDRDRVLAAGFDGYLPKPINVTTLISDLRRAVEKAALAHV